MSAIDDLVTELAKLPGIGHKTAQRLTFYLLKQPAESAARLADAIRNVRARVTTCGVCGTLTDGDPCAICADPRAGRVKRRGREGFARRECDGGHERGDPPGTAHGRERAARALADAARP